MIDIQDIKNPVNILQQPKSQMITNPYIQPNVPVTNHTPIVRKYSQKSFHHNISASIIGVLDDLLNKPSAVPWTSYLLSTLQKDQRYFYIGIFCLVLAIFLFLIRV